MDSTCTLAPTSYQAVPHTKRPVGAATPGARCTPGPDFQTLFMDTALPHSRVLADALKGLVSLKSLSDIDRITTKVSFLEALKCTGTTWLLSHLLDESPDTRNSTARSPGTDSSSSLTLDPVYRPSRGQQDLRAAFASDSAQRATWCRDPSIVQGAAQSFNLRP